MLTLDQFKEARGVLSGVIRNTSLVYSPAFSKATGNQIYIKPENMQVTGAYKIYINPEIKQELESVYAKNGLTLTDAINVFFQQSLNAGGFPFAVTEDNAEIIKAKALSRLTRQLQEAQDDPVSYSEDEVYKMFGVEK